MIITQKLQTHIATRKSRIVALLLGTLLAVIVLQSRPPLPLYSASLTIPDPEEKYQVIDYQANTDHIVITPACDWAKDDHSVECTEASRKALVGMGSDIRNLGTGKPKYQVCPFKKVGTGWGGQY